MWPGVDQIKSTKLKSFKCVIATLPTQIKTLKNKGNNSKKLELAKHPKNYYI